MQPISSNLHEAEYQTLRSLFYSDKNIALHHRDGYMALKALLPPHPQRGMVFIDSPFEKEDELTQLKTALQWGLEKWPTGTYVIWYPIKNNHQHILLLKNIRALGIEMLNAKILVTENVTSTQLTGTGMVILNPPWQFAEELKILLPYLWSRLSSQQQGNYQ